MKQKTLFADILETVTKYFLILVIIVVLGICCSGIRMVETGNVAVVLRFGRLVGDTYEEQVHEPGLLLAFPYIIDEVVIVPVGSVIEQSVTTHYTDPAEVSATKDGGYLLTGDQNIAVVSASVKYVISDPVAYATHVADLSSLINAAVSNAMLNEAAALEVDSLLTSGKDAYAKAVLTAAGEKLTRIGAGVTLTTVELTHVGMPEEVRATYEAVNAANVQATTTLEQARNYEATVLPAAQSKAASTVAGARSDKAKAVAAANTDLAEFWGVKTEFEANPAEVRARIYATKSIAVMQKIGKVYLVKEGNNGPIFIDP